MDESELYHEPELSIRSFVEGDELKHPQKASYVYLLQTSFPKFSVF
jgi:hypothetical protein